MIKMTKAQALKIQAEQIKWYVPAHRDDLRKIIAYATNAEALEDDVEYDVTIINRHIPRGGMLEHLIGINSKYND